MKKNIFAFLLISVISFVMMVGCSNSTSNKADNTEAQAAMRDLRSAEMTLAATLERNETIKAMRGEKGALEELDCSEYAKKMKEYDSLLKYNNLYMWMDIDDIDDIIDGIDEEIISLSDSDYEEVMKVFYGLSAEEQSKVLQNMFKDTGAVLNIKVPIEFGYVPTGETTEDGVDLTTYEATEYKELNMPIYACVPLDIDFK